MPRGRSSSSRAGPEPDGSIQGNAADADPAAYEPHYDVITAADQVQIYEPIMGDTEGKVTYTLLRAATYLKDNRLLPGGADKAKLPPEIAVQGRGGRRRQLRGRRRPDHLPRRRGLGEGAVHGAGRAAVPAARRTVSCRTCWRTAARAARRSEATSPRQITRRTASQPWSRRRHRSHHCRGFAFTGISPQEFIASGATSVRRVYRGESGRSSDLARRITAVSWKPTWLLRSRTRSFINCVLSALYRVLCHRQQVSKSSFGTLRRAYATAGRWRETTPIRSIGSTDGGPGVGSDAWSDGAAYGK